jgi:predicted metal-dependent HD superfamily phosphohydrolase
LILATKKHDASLERDAPLMVDVDLSILGRPTQRFDEYEDQIRQEYSWVCPEQFAAGRSAVLQSFLARPAIYCTEFFRNKYERQARDNLKRSLSKLQMPSQKAFG